MGDLTRSTVSQCDVLPPLTLSPPLPRLTFPESRFPSALTTRISSAQRLPRPQRRESLSLPKPNTPPQLSAKKTRGRRCWYPLRHQGYPLFGRIPQGSIRSLKGTVPPQAPVVIFPLFLLRAVQ